MQENRKEIEKEFEELFKKNYPRLFYYALDWVEDSETAKDLTSETFGEVWKQYSRIRNTEDGKYLESYLFKTLRNKSINYLRHKSIEAQYQEQILQTKEEAIDEDINVHEENLQLIGKVMEELSPQTRFIFEQCFFEGKKYQEIADILGVSSSAIHKHMHKAFTSFREAFDKNKKEQNKEIKGNRFFSWLFFI